MKRSVEVSLQFAALHSWPDCDVLGKGYLRNTHRHVFHIKARARVFHNDRDIEFIELKEFIQDCVRPYENTDMGSMSCEALAEKILKEYKNIGVYWVSVHEDGENGAIVEVEDGDRNN